MYESMGASPSILGHFDFGTICIIGAIDTGVPESIFLFDLSFSLGIRFGSPHKKHVTLWDKPLPLQYQTHDRVLDGRGYDTRMPACARLRGIPRVKGRLCSLLSSDALISCTSLDENSRLFSITFSIRWKRRESACVGSNGPVNRNGSFYPRSRYFKLGVLYPQAGVTAHHDRRTRKKKCHRRQKKTRPPQAKKKTWQPELKPGRPALLLQHPSRVADDRFTGDLAKSSFAEILCTKEDDARRLSAEKMVGRRRSLEPCECRSITRITRFRGNTTVNAIFKPACVVLSHIRRVITPNPKRNKTHGKITRNGKQKNSSPLLQVPSHGGSACTRGSSEWLSHPFALLPNNAGFRTPSPPEVLLVELGRGLYLF